MIERDQKKGHQNRRNHSPHSIRKPLHHTHSIKGEAIAQQLNISKPTAYLPQMITNTPLSMINQAANGNQKLGLSTNADASITDMGPLRPNGFIDMTHANVGGANNTFQNKNENFVLYNPRLKDGMETGSNSALGLATSNTLIGYPQSISLSYVTPLQLPASSHAEHGKGNQLPMSSEQKEAMQNSFLFQLREDQQQSKSLRFVYTIPTVSQCMNCLRTLGQDKLGVQLCETCQRQKSVIHIFSYYLSILRYNRKNDLYKLTLLTKISPSNLLNSGPENTGKDVVTSLYEKFIFPINNATGAEFVVIDQKIHQEKARKSEFINIALKCTNDPGCSKDVSNDDIDPEALLMDSSNAQSGKYYATSTNRQKKGCNSLITISYDLMNGDLAMSFSHKAH